MPALSFEKLRELPELKRCYDLAWRLFAVNIALVSPDGRHGICLGDARRQTGFCRALHRQGGLPLCGACDRQHIRTCLKQGTTLRYRCHAGLTEFLVPVVLDGEVMAFLQCGQILDRPADDAAWQRAARSLSASAIAPAGLRRSFASIPHLPVASQNDLIALLELMVHSIARSEKTKLSLQEAPYARLVTQANEFIAQHLCDELSLQRIAGHLHVSSRTLTRAFRERTGHSVVELIQRQRLAHACTLLRESTRSCLDVALSSGFGSVQHFNRVFRAIHQTTPRAWRSTLI